MKRIIRRPLLLSVAAFLLAIAAAVSISYLYLNNLNKSFNRETTAYLSEIADQSVNTLQKQIHGDLLALKSLAVLLETPGTELMSEDTMQMLRTVCSRNSFKRLGVLMEDGVAHTTDGLTMLLGDREYYKQVFQGESVVSDELIDRAGGDKINVYAVPIYRDGAVAAILFATHNIEDYNQSLSLYFFHDQGYSYLVKSTGDCVVGSPHPNSISGEGNILEYLQENQAANSGSVDQMRADFLGEQRGYIRATINAAEQYINYVPAGINDWYLLTIVPDAVVSEKTQEVLRDTLFICIGLTGVFLLLVLYLIASQRQAQQAMKKIAYQDPLTGGDNYALFCTKVRKALQSQKGGHFALVQYDIDQFKYINVRFGYTMGDRVLTSLHQLTQSTLRAGECAARMSNDLFVALVHESTREDLEKRIDLFTKKAGEIPSGLHIDCRLLLSVGIYWIEDTQAALGSMVDFASIARKSAKGDRISPYRFYTAEMRDRMLSEKAMENEMEAALRNYEFQVYYQPKYAVETSRIVGAEALVRWNHPKNGLLMPGDFIPLFERNGFIIRMDLYVFDEVCHTIRSRLNQQKNVVPISVNISRLHLYRHNFVEEFRRILKEYRIPEGLIELELTETSVFENRELLTQIIERLHQSGVLLSMDDFGTGYSSLNMLKDIPVDVIKIDREFFKETVDSERGKQIVRMVVELAQKLGIHVVAEGVETSEQIAFLKEISCGVAQGYYYSKPVNKEAFAEMLERIDVDLF